MSVNAISPNASPAASTGSASTAGSTTSNSMKDEFLQLLTVQLKNQDPLKPVDQTAMLSQLAQFSSLEQMQNLNQTMSASANFGNMTQSAGLIGKYVTTYNSSDGSMGPSGKVEAVLMKNNVAYLDVGGLSVPASQVLTVSGTDPSSGATL